MMGKSGSGSLLPVEMQSAKYKAADSGVNAAALSRIVAGIAQMNGAQMKGPDTKELFKAILLRKLAGEDDEEKQKEDWQKGTTVIIGGDKEII